MKALNFREIILDRTAKCLIGLYNLSIWRELYNCLGVFNELQQSIVKL